MADQGVTSIELPFGPQRCGSFFDMTEDEIFLLHAKRLGLADRLDRLMSFVERGGCIGMTQQNKDNIYRYAERIVHEIRTIDRELKEHKEQP